MRRITPQFIGPPRKCVNALRINHSQSLSSTIGIETFGGFEKWDLTMSLQATIHPGKTDM